MFACFTAPDTISSGAVRPAIRPTPRFSIATRPCSPGSPRHRPLRVVRVPMPGHDDGVWLLLYEQDLCEPPHLMPTYRQ